MKIPDFPKNRLTVYERELWKVKFTEMLGNFKGFKQLHYSHRRSNSQSSWRPYFLSIWGISGEVVKFEVTTLTVGENTIHNQIELRWTGVFYSGTDNGMGYYFIPKDLKFYSLKFDPNITEITKDRNRGKPFNPWIHLPELEGF